MPDFADLWPFVAGSMAKSDGIYGQIKLPDFTSMLIPIKNVDPSQKCHSHSNKQKGLITDRETDNTNS